MVPSEDLLTVGRLQASREEIDRIFGDEETYNACMRMGDDWAEWPERG